MADFSFYIGNKTYQNKKSSFLYLFVSTFALTPLLSSSPEFPGCFLKRLRSYPYNLIRIMPAKGVQIFYRFTHRIFCTNFIKMRSIILSILLFHAVLLPCAANKYLADTSLLQPVELLAIRAADKTPVAKTNLSKEDILKTNTMQDLPFILNQTPSVIVNSDAGNGIGYTGIRIRGTDASRINVTINGIPYNDAESRGTFFVDMPDIASSAGSIQIQRGVGTSTNGAGSFWRQY